MRASRLLLGMLLIGLWAPLARADLDAEQDRPYLLQVVLHMSDNRVFSQVFRDKVQREVGDSLQAALGKLARVEVASSHPRLAEVEEKGLQRALDGWNFITGTKLHFVFIDYVDGRYEIQARQYDGLAGLASPVLRMPPAPITDRQLVARSAALLVSEDFGVVGTVGRPDNDKVEVAIKGATVPGASLSPWLRRGDVFAVTQIVHQGADQRSYRQDWTLLVAQDEPQNGICPCRLFHRYKGSLQAGAGVAGYRCLKLHTVRAPLRLRLVAKDSPGTPLSGRTIQVRSQGFEGAAETRTTDNDGLIRTSQSYDNAAFVQILDSSEMLAQLPVQLIDDRPITVAVEPRRGGDQRAKLDTDRRQWQRKVYDTVEIATAIVRDFNDLMGLQAHDKAMAKLQEGVKILDTDLIDLKAKRASLGKEAASLNVALDLSQEEESLRDLETRGAQMKDRIANLQKTLQEESDPQRRKWAEMAEQARSLQEAYEFDKAIALYEKILAEGSEDKSVRAQLEQLKTAWAIKSPEHRQARAFIYQELPRVQNAADMKAKFKQAQDAFEVCRQVDDRLTPRMLLKVIGNITGKLAKELESLRVDTQDDRTTAETIKSVSDDLRRLSEEATDFLKKEKK
jgi:tetratricopeptide (TPR) repeat protein